MYKRQAHRNWLDLPYSLKTGEPAFRRTGASDSFTHMAENPEDAAVFDKAMANFTRQIAPVVAAAYDFSGPAAYAINRYRITTANDAASRDPRDWKLQGCGGGCAVGSDAGWIDLDTRTAQLAGAGRFQTNTYTFPNATAYPQYRLRVTANNGSADTSQIGELELFDGP